MASSTLVLAAVLSVLYFQQTSAVTYCNTVNIQAVYKCYQTYMAGFNVKMTDTIPEYWVFRNARSALFQKNGKNEENQNCQFTNTLLNCLDNDFECMGQETFITLGASNSTEAVDYWADLLVNQYQCTPQGLKLKLDNFSCYENCRKDHSSEIDKCHSDLFDNMNGEMDVCLALQTNANCNSDIQRKCCGYNASVLACNSEVAASRAFTPPCSQMGKVSCPVAK